LLSINVFDYTIKYFFGILIIVGIVKRISRYVFLKSYLIQKMKNKLRALGTNKKKLIFKNEKNKFDIFGTYADFPQTQFQPTFIFKIKIR
jgi:hypothetical protein